jgi:hypothetical protein
MHPARRRLRQQEGGHQYLAVAELDGGSMEEDMQLIGSSMETELVFKLLVKAMWALRPRLAEAQQRAFAAAGQQADVWSGAEGQQLLEQVRAGCRVGSGGLGDGPALHSRPTPLRAPLPDLRHRGGWLGQLLGTCLHACPAAPVLLPGFVISGLPPRRDCPRS